MNAKRTRLPNQTRTRIRTRLRQAGAIAVASAALSGHASANPPLTNPSFEIVGPGGSPTVNTSALPGGAGISSADAWGVFHNTAPATTETELVPSTLPAGGARMIHIETDGLLNGISQVTGPPWSGSLHGIASAWVLVNSGVVGMGSGNHGNTEIDVQTTTTGVWEFIQAPSGHVPFNTILFYDQSGGADFYVEEANMLELQNPSLTVPLEYSSRFDAGGNGAMGGQSGNDPGQVLYTEPIDDTMNSLPTEAQDFAPQIENQFEPDAQIDALANGGDGGFQALIDDETDLLFSLESDPGVADQVAVYREGIDGANGPEYTHSDLYAGDLTNNLLDVDALEMWGTTGNPSQPGDADYYSYEFDVGASVWYAGTTPVVYLTPTEIAGALTSLGFDGLADDVDVDALMVQDTGVPGYWDHGDAVIFSIRPFADWDGGEIVYWEFGQAAAFLGHAGHVWDTAFNVASVFEAPLGLENVDALEAIPVPEPARIASLGLGLGLLFILKKRHATRRPNARSRHPRTHIGC